MSDVSALYLSAMRPRLNVIQSEYLRGTSRGRMILGRLREALDRPVGDEPEAVRWSLHGVPDGLGYWPFTPLERASWVSFALYAHHQRGMHFDRMQRDGVAFVEALRVLRSRSGASVCLSRLRGLGDPVEAGRALFPLVEGLREAHVPFDHALLALDLASVGSDAFADVVLPSWLARVS